MFDRKAYKKKALEQLKKRWSIPVLVTILITLIMSLCNIQDVVVKVKAGSIMESSDTAGFATVVELLVWGVFYLAACHLAIVLIKTYNTDTSVSIGDFFNGLSEFLNGVLGGLWFTLWVSLWSIIFVVPGIIKAISYSQMFYIMAENPGIGPMKAMRLSKEMTKGYKSDLFVMYLSFIGWELLSLVTLGIGSFWVKPYETMSFANAYFDLKAHAFRSGVLVPSDFE